VELRLAASRSRIEDLSVHGWDIASLPAPALLALETEIATAFGWGDCVPVVTCQRYEVITLGKSHTAAPRSYHGEEALLHLARIAAGLESLVLGEAEILGQLRTALASAPAPLRRLSAPAIAAARVLKREQGFTEHAGYALDHGLEIAGVAPEGRIVVVGGGPMGRRTVERAVDLGFSDVTLVARRPLPLPEPIEYRPFSALASLARTDVLVTCLGRTAPALGCVDLPEVTRVAIDLGTPRNLRPDVAAPVVNLAALVERQRTSAVESERREQLRERLRELLIARLEVTGYDFPLGSMREEVERIRQRELERALRLHPDLPVEKLDTITRSLVNQIFHRPSMRLRRSDDPELVATVAALFSARIEEAADDRG
jgi:glutamyl-tRNA reductase